MRLGKVGEPNLTENAIDKFEFGKIRYLKKGKEIAIISYGITVKIAIELSIELEKQGKSVSVISCHTIKPLDKVGIKKVLNEYKSVYVLEEHVPHGGLSSRVKEIASDEQTKAELKSFTLKDEFIHFYGNHQELLEKHELSVKQILKKI